MGGVVLSLDDLVEAFERNIPMRQQSYSTPAVVADHGEAGGIAFELPVILNGRHVGHLSGHAQLYSPSEVLRNTNTLRSPVLWKFEVVREYFMKGPS